MGKVRKIVVGPNLVFTKACAGCGVNFKGTFGVTEKGQSVMPEEGSLMICADCLAVNTITSTGDLRLATAEDLEKATKDPFFAQLLSQYKNRRLSINGFLFPAHPDNSPLLALIEGGEVSPMQHFLPVFRTKEELDQHMQSVGVLVYKIKQIDDEDEFIPSVLEQGIRIAVRPRRCPETGKLLWTQILLDT